ncbi:MAG: Sec-independent protein translocase subunit TatA [Trebonia sp.]
MNFGDLFDSPWKILIVAIVIIVLFGSRKLPDAARSLGKSMRILKTEVKGLHEDDDEPGTTTAQAAPAQIAPSAPVPDAQVQIAALQEQLNSLQQQNAASATASPQAASAETQQAR